MISYRVKTNGTVTVKQVNIGTKGKIYYKFKGMMMHPESGMVVDLDKNRLTVKRDSDEQLSNFIKKNKIWLLEHNDNPTSLLYGTEFVPSNVI